MNGLIVVNKEKGYTSRDVVNILGKILGTKKIGHTGTLDPIAEGVLVCVMGKCTKLCDILVSDEKEYIATMEFGYLTDTLDNTGNVLKTSDKLITLSEVKEALNHFCGEYLQEVPIFSAVKVNGKKLYEYARNNIEVTPPSKEIEVYSITLLEGPIYKENTIEFKIKCTVSKGTYIRGLIRDIGYKLGTYGTMKSLIRTKQGNFDIESSYTLEDIENDNYKLLSIKESLPDIKTTVIEGNLLNKVKNGMVLDKFFDEEISLLITKEGKEIAIYKNIDGKAKPFKMIEV